MNQEFEFHDACTVCGQIVHRNDEAIPVCRACTMRYPDELVKAIIDPYSYGLKLVTGEVYYFSEARFIGGEWLHLMGDVGTVPNKCEFHRGLSVRWAQVVSIFDLGR